MGGGHSHSVLLRAVAAKGIDSVSITLISSTRFATYSGMLPGVISGDYPPSAMTIDLQALCQRAGACFIEATIRHIDAERQILRLADGRKYHYDIASIDIGSQSDVECIAGSHCATPVKPIHEMLESVAQIEQRLIANPKLAMTLSVVGAGAAGVELILALACRFKDFNMDFTLVSKGSGVLSGYPVSVQKSLVQRLCNSGITLLTDTTVSNVSDTAIHSTEGKTLASDVTFLCTPAVGASWLRNCGLPLTEKNFILVNQYLQVEAFPTLFAVGDICHFTPQPLAKAGVYAVRMGDSLLDNIIKLACDKPLAVYKPQQDFLSLLACGDRYAIGCKWGITFYGAWVWRLKNYIDQRFMASLRG